MKVIIEKIQSYIVMHVSGRIDARTAVEFEKRLFEEKGDGLHDVIIDFKDVEYISSAGLRVLLVLSRAMSNTNKNVVLCGMNESIIDVIRITGFLTLFSVYSDLKSVFSGEERICS